MANVIPNIFMTALADNSMDFMNDTLIASLMMTTSFDEEGLRDTETFGDISTNGLGDEITNADYSPTTVTGQNVTTDDGTNRMTFIINDLAFTAGASDFPAARYIAIYDQTNNDKLIYIIDLTRDVVITSGGTLNIIISSDGIITCDN